MSSRPQQPHGLSLVDREPLEHVVPRKPYRIIQTTDAAVDTEGCTDSKLRIRFTPGSEVFDMLFLWWIKARPESSRRSEPYIRRVA